MWLFWPCISTSSTVDAHVTTSPSRSLAFLAQLSSYGPKYIKHFMQFTDKAQKIKALYQLPLLSFIISTCLVFSPKATQCGSYSSCPQANTPHPTCPLILSIYAFSYPVTLSYSSLPGATLPPHFTRHWFSFTLSSHHQSHVSTTPADLCSLCRLPAGPLPIILSIDLCCIDER